MATNIYSDFSALEGDLEDVAESVELQLSTPVSKYRIGLSALATAAAAMLYSGDRGTDLILKGTYMGLSTVLGVGLAYGFKRSEITAPLAAFSYYLMASRSSALDYSNNGPLFVEAFVGALSGEGGDRLMAMKPAAASTSGCTSKTKSKSSCACSS